MSRGYIKAKYKLLFTYVGIFSSIQISQLQRPTLGKLAEKKIFVNV